MRAAQTARRSSLDLDRDNMFLSNIFDDWTEEAVLSPGPVLKFPKEALEIMKEHPIEYRVFRMSQAADPCLGSRDKS